MVRLHPGPWGRGLINFEAQEEELALETYRTWARLFELQRHYSWIVDRFHISTQAHQLRVRGQRYDFAWLEEQALMRDLVARSALPSLTLDTSDDDVDGAAGRVADWLEATGGMAARAMPWVRNACLALGSPFRMGMES